MDTRKLSFRLLSALTIAVFALLLAAACSSATPAPTPEPVTIPSCRADSQEHINEVFDKYRGQLWREPNTVAVVKGHLMDEYGNRVGDVTDGRADAIVVIVCKTRKNTRPGEYRAPDCLEGVPVQVQEEPNFPIIFHAVLPNNRYSDCLPEETH